MLLISEDAYDVGGVEVLDGREESASDEWSWEGMADTIMALSSTLETRER